MKEYKLTSIRKDEVVIKSTEIEIGKVQINYEHQIMTFIGSAISLSDATNSLFDIMAKEIDKQIPLPFPGDMVMPGNWTIIFKSE